MFCIYEESCGYTEWYASGVMYRRVFGTQHSLWEFVHHWCVR